MTDTGNCILCGKCMEVCPLLRASGQEELSPRAKANLSALLASDIEALQEKDAAELAGLCLGCGRCKQKCPQGVDVPALVADLRGKHPGFRGWLWNKWLKHARELWPSTSLAARLIPSGMQPERLSPFLKAMQLLKSGNGLKPFVRIKTLPKNHAGTSMMLFSGCTARYVRPEWQHTALDLLSRLGIDVVKGKFGCCGMGLECAGFQTDAAQMRDTNVLAWRKAGKPKIVTLCASCHKGLAEYSKNFEDAVEARQWIEALTPISRLVLQGCYVLTPQAPEWIGYHRPCHMQHQDTDHAFLSAVLGEKLLEPDDRQCCGFGGVMQLGSPELCTQVNERCWQSLDGADTVLTGCSACVAQLAASAPENIQVGHWLEILDLEDDA